MKYSYALLFLSLFSCSSNKVQPAYSIEVGEEFAFEIRANPTTAYYWAWANEKTVRNVTLKSRVYSGHPGSEELIGSGGTELWTFRGKKPGVDTLRLRYISHADKVIDPKNSDVLTIVVTVE